MKQPDRFVEQRQVALPYWKCVLFTRFSGAEVHWIYQFDK